MRIEINNQDADESEKQIDISVLKPELSYDELVQKSRDEMTFKQKIRYFWDYHKWKVIIPIAIICFVIVVVTGYIRETKPTDLNVKIINCNDDALLNDFITKYSEDQMAKGTLKLGINTEGYYIHPEVVDEMTAADSTVATSMQKYQSAVLSGQMDVTIATDWVLKEYGKANVYLDLSKELPQELLGNVEDKLVYTQTDDGKDIAVGVYIDESDALTKSFGNNRPVYGIFSKTEKKENAIMLLLYLIGK